MDRKKKAPEFDEKALAAAEHLLENFWILRGDDAEIYQAVREREKALRLYFMDKLGFSLIVHRDFAKLEKIPAEAEPWMGIQSFTETRDYALFCCLLAFLEDKNVDEQFLLSDLCEALAETSPLRTGLDWTNYNHRRSLVRVMQYASEQGLVLVVDGDVSGFGQAEESEVLYEVPPVSRYFMPAYPKELPGFNSVEEILAGDWRELKGMEDQAGMRRRHYVYRKLFLSPVMYSGGGDDPDFLYLRNFRERIREDIEQHTGYRFELFANAAMLTLPERRQRFTYFPDNRALADLAMQLAGLAREKYREEEIPLQEDGSLWLTEVEFERWVRECKDRFGSGWSKQYREALPSEVASELLAFLELWLMAERVEHGVVVLKPLLVRTVCRYPDDFDAGHDVQEGLR